MSLKTLVEEWYQSEADNDCTDQQNWLGWDGWVCFEDLPNNAIKHKAEN